MSTLSKFGRAALQYAKAGFAVFPCIPAGKSPYSDLAPHGHKDATTDLTIIRGWWERAPTANVGLVPPTGYVALDVDPRNGGTDSLTSRMNGAANAFDTTLVADTGGGGQHYLFRDAPANLPKALAPGLDLKGNSRGYIVVSPSVHESGNRYKWRDGFHPEKIQPWPSCLTPEPESEKPTEPLDPADLFSKEQLFELLSRIDADSYDKWISVGQIIKSAYGAPGFAHWVSWSKTSDKFPGEGALRKKWRSFKGTGLGLGTLVRMSGGKPPKPDPRDEFMDEPDAPKKPRKSSVQVTFIGDVVDIAPEFALYPVVPIGGVVVLGGTNKSTCAAVLASICVNGGMWPWGNDTLSGPGYVKPIGRVAVMNAEEDEGSVTGPRYKALGVTGKQVALFKPSTRLDKNGRVVGGWLTFDNDLLDIEAEIERLGDCKLLIVDPINSYYDPAKGGLNLEEEMRPRLMALTTMAQRQRIGIIIVVHLNKKSDQSMLDRLMGASAYKNVCRGVWMMVKDPEEPERGRVCVLEKSNLAPTGLAFGLIIDVRPHPQDPKYKLVTGRSTRSPGFTKARTTW